jgi:hypothetical protein
MACFNLPPRHFTREREDTNGNPQQGFERQSPNIV